MFHHKTARKARSKSQREWDSEGEKATCHVPVRISNNDGLNTVHLPQPYIKLNPAHQHGRPLLRAELDRPVHWHRCPCFEDLCGSGFGLSYEQCSWQAKAHPPSLFLQDGILRGAEPLPPPGCVSKLGLPGPQFRAFDALWLCQRRLPQVETLSDYSHTASLRYIWAVGGRLTQAQYVCREGFW